MNKHSILISTIVGFIALNSFVVQANPNHKKRHSGYSSEERRAPSVKGIMHRLSKLDLSDEQKEEIKVIVANGIESTKVQRETLQSMQHQMKALMHAESVDETAIRSTSLEMASIKSDLMILRLNKRNQIASLLNDEQKAKMEKMKQHRKTKRGK